MGTGSRCGSGPPVRPRAAGQLQARVAGAGAIGSKEFTGQAGPLEG